MEDGNLGLKCGSDPLIELKDGNHPPSRCTAYKARSKVREFEKTEINTKCQLEVTLAPQQFSPPQQSSKPGRWNPYALDRLQEIERHHYK